MLLPLLPHTQSIWVPGTLPRGPVGQTGVCVCVCVTEMEAERQRDHSEHDDAFPRMTVVTVVGAPHVPSLDSGGLFKLACESF